MYMYLLCCEHVHLKFIVSLVLHGNICTYLHNSNFTFFNSLLDFQPDSTFQPIIGPALKVGGHLLKWEGPPPKQPPKNSSQAMHSRAVKSEITLTGGRKEIELEKKTSTASLKDFTQEQKKAVDFERRQKPLELRVTFESNTQEMSTSHLEMENCGTAAVYYSWQVCMYNYQIQVQLLVYNLYVL